MELTELLDAMVEQKELEVRMDDKEIFEYMKKIKGENYINALKFAEGFYGEKLVDKLKSDFKVTFGYDFKDRKPLQELKQQICSH